MTERQIYFVLLISCFLGVQSYPNEDASFRIIGGKAVNITDFPFMARYCGPLYCCGAAIVHERFLISSANCYYEFEQLVPNFKYHVIIGTDKRHNEGEVYDIEDIYLHPRFYPESRDYDLAVLKLTKALKFNERVQSISLAEEDIVIPENAEFEVLGFGTSSTNAFDFKVPNQLQKVSVPYVPHEKCKHNFGELTERMICTGGKRKGSCFFDEGGPLVFENKLLGVLVAPGCGEKHYPSIYAYIPPLREFIDAVIENKA